MFQVALNASKAWNKWSTLESGHTKVLGHRRSKPGTLLQRILKNMLNFGYFFPDVLLT